MQGWLFDLDDAYPALFSSVAQEIDALTLARYRPNDYRLDRDSDHRARGLAGLLRTSLLKRFESSVHAFSLTLQKMAAAHTSFLAALDAGLITVPGPGRRGPSRPGEGRTRRPGTIRRTVDHAEAGVARG